MSTAELNELSTIILNWIREMDQEEGPTLREVTENHGGAGDAEKIGVAIRAAFMSLNAPFLLVAPTFLKNVFKDCVQSIDWPGIVRQRLAETKDE